jgi:hypothetical protein
LVSSHQKEKGSSSFLKKRTKKLLSIAGSTQSAFLARLPAALGKSFLLLFFKKEGLPSFFYLITAAS